MTSATTRPKYLSPEIEDKVSLPFVATSMEASASFAATARARSSGHFDFISGASTPRMRTETDIVCCGQGLAVTSNVSPSMIEISSASTGPST
jgi:hypothetical protein